MRCYYFYSITFKRCYFLVHYISIKAPEDKVKMFLFFIPPFPSLFLSFIHLFFLFSFLLSFISFNSFIHLFFFHVFPSFLFLSFMSEVYFSIFKPQSYNLQCSTINCVYILNVQTFTFHVTALFFIVIRCDH